MPHLSLTSTPFINARFWRYLTIAFNLMHRKGPKVTFVSVPFLTLALNGAKNLKTCDNRTKQGTEYQKMNCATLFPCVSSKPSAYFILSYLHLQGYPFSLLWEHSMVSNIHGLRRKNSLKRRKTLQYNKLLQNSIDYMWLYVGTPHIISSFSPMHS